MQNFSGTQFLRALAVCLGIGALTVGICLPMRAQEVPLKQQLRGRHRLLRRVYVNAPDTDVKGLAASIKADEVTVKHRVRAVRYLATIDTVAYPEAKEMLLDRLHNDRWEEVRYEAAKALRLMMAGNAGGQQRTPRLFRMWLRRWRRHTRRSFRTRVRGRFDFESNPCDARTLNALVRTAYELDCDGYCFEPSMRVRTMAVLAIRASGVACDVGPYIAGEQMRMQSDVELPTEPLTGGRSFASIEQERPTSDDFGNSIENELASAFGDESKLTDEAFAPLVEPIRVEVEDGSITQTNGISDDEKSLWDFAEATVRQPSQKQTTGTEPDPFIVEEPIAVPRPIETPAVCLRGKCIVGLMLGQQIAANSEYQATYEDRLYHFSSASALARFQSDPEQYALAYSGFDPVAYASSQTVLDGKLLRFYEGRYYAFASEDNWNEFRSQPDLYALRNEDLLSDDEFREQTQEEFEAIEAAMQQVESNPAAYGLEDADIEFDFGEEPTIAEVSPVPSPEPATTPTEPAVADTELSYGPLDDNTARIADFSDVSLAAPAPAMSSQPGAQDSSKREHPLVVPNDEPIDFGEPEEALSEIEKIFGVKIPETPKPSPRTPDREVAPEPPRFKVERPKPIIESRRPAPTTNNLLRIAPITQPSTRVSGWSNDRKSVSRQKSGKLRASSITTNATTRPVQVRPIERVQLGTGTRSIRDTLPAQSKSEPIRAAKPSSRSSLDTSRSRVERLVPGATSTRSLNPLNSSASSLRMKSDPSKVTNITRRGQQ